MEIGHIIPHIEALVFASDKPLTPIDITELINNAFGFMEDKVTMEQVQAAMEGIVEKYRSEFYPFEMRESGGGWQFLTKKDYHKTVAQLNGEKFLKRLSAAALETLAIIAYKQPITKSEIESIRGVSCDYSIQKLLEKELIVISGRNEELPGKPLIYNTSRNFMDYFGINSPEDLPKLKEVFDDNMVLATAVGPAGAAGEADIAAGQDDGSMVVTENGELADTAGHAPQTGTLNGHVVNLPVPEGEENELEIELSAEEEEDAEEDGLEEDSDQEEEGLEADSEALEDEALDGDSGDQEDESLEEYPEDGQDEDRNEEDEEEGDQEEDQKEEN